MLYIALISKPKLRTMKYTILLGYGKYSICKSGNDAYTVWHKDGILSEHETLNDAFSSLTYHISNLSAHHGLYLIDSGEWKRPVGHFEMYNIKES